MLLATLQTCCTVSVILLMCLTQVVVGKKQKDLEIIVQNKPPDCSTVVENGDEVSVHYTGFLDSGVIFDSSIQQKREPLTFVLGQRKVIPGWEQGILGMCIGEKRKLIIPPHLAYGEKGHPPVIPESATLTFETELVDVKKTTTSIFDGIEIKLFQTVQMLVFPALALYICYYLYSKYRQEVSETKTVKDSKDGRRKKKK